MNEDIDTSKDPLQRAFDLKLADLLDDNALAIRPALILQASMGSPAYIDLSNTQLQDVFRKGGGAQGSDVCQARPLRPAEPGRSKLRPA